MVDNNHITTTNRPIPRQSFQRPALKRIKCAQQQAHTHSTQSHITITITPQLEYFAAYMQDLRKLYNVAADKLYIYKHKHTHIAAPFSVRVMLLSFIHLIYPE